MREHWSKDLEDAFAQDDVGYITHIIPPKEVPLTETAVEFLSIDVNKTQALTGVGSTGHLFLQGQTNADVKPETVLQGYRIGARTNDTLRVLVSYGTSTTEYTARIVMPDSELSGEKLFTVNRSVAGINSVGTYSAGGTSNVITFTGAHSFLNGESIRILSDDGHLPEALHLILYILPSLRALVFPPIPTSRLRDSYRHKTTIQLPSTRKVVF